MQTTTLFSARIKKASLKLRPAIAAWIEQAYESRLCEMSSVGAPQRQLGPDLIRATAVSSVFFSHAVPWKAAAEKLNLQSLDFWGYQLGFWGVEIFFVLSGFLIGGILIGELFSGRIEHFAGLWTFWKRRWYRTLPNYFLFFSLFIFVAWWFDDSSRGGALPYAFFSQSLLSQHPLFFGTAWSLAVEEWFYLLFPAMLLIAIKVFRSPRLALFLGILFFVATAMFLRGSVSLTSWDEGVRKATFLRLDSLMFGVVLALIKAHHTSLWRKLGRLWWVGVAVAAGILSWWYSHHTKHGDLNPSPLFNRVFLLTLISISIFLIFPKVADMTDRDVPFPGVRNLALKLSLWSYSIYLSHALIIILVNAALSQIEWPLPGLRAAVAFPVVTITTLISSALVFQYFEKPIMSLRDRSKIYVTR